MITIPAAIQGQTPIIVEQKPITDDDFEGFIDTLEKIVVFTKRKDEKSLIESFQRFGEQHLREKLNRTIISRYLIPYWKQGRDRKKRVAFVRKFWENPDSNDSDATAAFKKRNDHNKMQLRQVQKTLKMKLTLKTDVRDETVINVVRDLIPDVWKREAIKQSLDKIHDMTFDQRYEALMKEKNMPIKQELIKMTVDELEPRPFEQYNRTLIEVPPRYKEEPKPTTLQQPHTKQRKNRIPGAGRPPINNIDANLVNHEDSGDGTNPSNLPDDEDSVTEPGTEVPTRGGRGTGRGGRPPNKKPGRPPSITVTNSV